MANQKLGNLGNIIELSILSYSQNWKLGLKIWGKNFQNFRGFQVFDLANFGDLKINGRHEIQT